MTTEMKKPVGAGSFCWARRKDDRKKRVSLQNTSWRIPFHTLL